MLTGIFLPYWLHYKRVYMGYPYPIFCLFAFSGLAYYRFSWQTAAGGQAESTVARASQHGKARPKKQRDPGAPDVDSHVENQCRITLVTRSNLPGPAHEQANTSCDGTCHPLGSCNHSMLSSPTTAG